jgi:membrane associated rhomboid family serine protease
MVPADVGVQCVDCVRTAPSRVISGRRLLTSFRPYLTYALIAVNVAVWAAGVGLGILGGNTGALLGGGGLLLNAGALWGPKVAAGEWWRLITAGFLHTGLFHVGLNMAALFVFGPPVERVLGRVRYGVLYTTSLLAGSLGVMLLSPNSVTVGASGAIFGLLGALVVAQRSARISLRSSGIIPLIVINLVFTVAVPGISIGGHLGGLAGGLLAGSVLFNRRFQGRGALTAVALCVALGAACFAASLWLAAHPIRL